QVLQLSTQSQLGFSFRLNCVAQMHHSKHALVILSSEGSQIEAPATNSTNSPSTPNPKERKKCGSPYPLSSMNSIENAPPRAAFSTVSQPTNSTGRLTRNP